MNMTPLDSRIQPNMPVPFMSLGYHLRYTAPDGYPHWPVPESGKKEAGD